MSTVRYYKASPGEIRSAGRRAHRLSIFFGVVCAALTICGSIAAKEEWLNAPCLIVGIVALYTAISERFVLPLRLKDVPEYEFETSIKVKPGDTMVLTVEHKRREAVN